MRSFAEWVFDFGYEREWYEPVRNDFIRWYSFAYDHPTVQKSFSDKNVSELAYRAGRSAINYESDNPVVNTIDMIEEMRAKLQTILHYLIVFSSIFGLLAAGAWQIDVNIIVPSFLGTISVLFFSPPALYFVLKHQIYSNIELIRKMNRELAIVDLELWTNRSPQHRVAYFLWNRSLNKPRTVAFLIFLALLRSISPHIYGRVNATLRENMAAYVERGVWEVTKEELQNVWATE